jgi:hypothetical protein
MHSAVVPNVSVSANMTRLRNLTRMDCSSQAHLGVDCGWQEPGTTGCLRFHPMPQCVVHALKGLACRARITPASSPASHYKQSSRGVQVAFAPRARLRQSFSRSLRSQKTYYIFLMGPKTLVLRALPQHFHSPASAPSTTWGVVRRG